MARTSLDTDGTLDFDFIIFASFKGIGLLAKKIDEFMIKFK